ncbi:aldose epimerase family protein [Pseudalkalibacillus hwajinpoensis]|uniref:aldose epimerase family protein n=1 Tax=Guptibacillus hwajinpoensis TaxID=208199 RepID=UPI00325BC09A
MKISSRKFGELQGNDVSLYTLINENGMEVSCLDYGCIITKILTPDAEGSIENIVLGFDELEDYLNYSPYFGSVIGRVGGRIAKGQFELNGETYELPKNDGENHLHGGPNGFDKVIWRAQEIDRKDEVGLEFSYISADGEEGYPGKLDVTVTYLLTNDNELVISYTGVSDRDTLVNLTNHTYFNLSGNLKETIVDHELVMKSNQFLELNEELIPTGNQVNVTDTSFDFRNGSRIAEGIKSSYSQNVLVGNGYDHPFMLNETNNNEIILSEPISGRQLIIETTEPCVVLYTGNNIPENFNIRDVPSEKYLGMCLETQAPPDAINHADFPSIILEKGKQYTTKTSYKFGVMK